MIHALKQEPGKLIPGKVKVYNVIQKMIPKSHLLSVQPGTIVTFVFDTDIPVSKYLKKNIESLEKYCIKTQIVYLPQVMNLEDELVRCTDVKKVSELTKSNGNKNFKADFCRMKSQECRNMLEHHGIDVSKLWTTCPPDVFGFVQRNCSQIKSNAV